MKSFGMVDGSMTLVLAFSMYLVDARAPAEAQALSGARLTVQAPAEQSNSNIVRDALNRPCLDVEAAARAHVVNPDLIDHVVSVKNNCPRLIKVKVCYFNSQHCNPFDVAGYKRVDTVLGTMTRIRMFKYTVFQH